MNSEQPNGPPYPKARRTYRILGLIHAVLFGAILAQKPFASGEYGVAIAGFVTVGGFTLAVFWHIANDHYRGNVPGEPGSLVYEGDGNE